MTAAQVLKKESPGPKDMVRIPGGRFMMGSDHHYPEEAPAHEVSINAFAIDVTPVTSWEFSQFVAATGYVTKAEQPANPDDYPGADPALLVPSSVVFASPSGPVDMRNHYNWWSYVAGADWRHPWGPDSDIPGREDHPVVHIAFEDAQAYANWAGKALPTEAEWEFAARGGLTEKEFAWDDELMPDGKPMAHTWQGHFPYENRNEIGTAPVGSYPPNGYGLYDMIGNVWEWTADWYGGYEKKTKSCCSGESKRGASVDPAAPGIPIPRKVTKGGSFLCAPNYCRRYRPAARMAQPIDTSTCHLGFRCVVRKP